VGAFLLLGAAIGAAIGGAWAFMKASGAEVDICNGPSCTSGWYYAASILMGAVVVGAIGVTLLRASRSSSASVRHGRGGQL
jgi:hypothetical protein